MPSSFIRKHVRGLLRSKFGPSTSLDHENQAAEATTPRGDENNEFLANCFLNGIALRKEDFPEVYFGKTGLDLPSIPLESLECDVFASYTGPDGGLTEVGEVRAQQMIQMANIDDEMSLSIGGSTDDEDEEDEDLDAPLSANLKKSSRNSLLLGSCSSLLGPNGEQERVGKPSADDYDWTAQDSNAAFGISVSLYEKNPLTGVNAGDPIADVWGVVGRNNNGILALADGVNWGEGARLAARCAIRGAIDHMNGQVINNSMSNSTEVFHEMLAAFHSAHSLILQEGGMLTTLCLALVAPMKCGNGWVLCVCNVGDSLCFVYNKNYGVREVTLGSHDIDQMRDMRDAGGALGPVDGRNPQLHNLTCSMTFVEAGDIVFITSDGVSDNFDPVVGKFCVIKKSESENKENSHLPPRQNRALDISTNDSKNREFAKNRTCAASLPCVDAAGRHSLMLLRMRDIISNGLTPATPTLPIRSPDVTASLLCQRLIQFATQLSQAKRRVLENPELYKKEKMTRTEQKQRRKMVREKIAEMPGKLDHASVVAYEVGRQNQQDTPSKRLSGESTPEKVSHKEEHFEFGAETTSCVNFENFGRVRRAECEAIAECEAFETVSLTIKKKSPPISPARYNMKGIPHPTGLMLSEIATGEKNNNTEKPISPYEQIPLTAREEVSKKKKKHSRGSIGRHTMDLQWLRKQFMSRKDDQKSSDDIRGDVSLSSGNPDRLTLGRKLKGILGSNKNLTSKGTSK
ncbi:unnamed protein product [Caenorhabditis bovis]|uniref:PPM-type phosphatase domain-containing protein n=1 Tax=Caenorhabditis bovis TaxID=2654633 RepID=A0A8S1EJB4_9PELO|nr:unnamed protein product [Caenorhabditis bovis]